AEQTELDNIAKVSSLTPAQLRVFYFLCEGQMNKQIAYEMSITEATVKAHITSIYKKLGVRTRTQAVLLASSLREFKSEA
ncbi:MAG: DNA-binding NarL/FixJ family response regulator, partial [Gammaproteobacteria bacterium]